MVSAAEVPQRLAFGHPAARATAHPVATGDFLGPRVVALRIADQYGEERRTANLPDVNETDQECDRKDRDLCAHD